MLGAIHSSKPMVLRLTPELTMFPLRTTAEELPSSTCWSGKKGTKKKDLVKLLQLGSRLFIFAEIEFLHFSELQNGSRFINLQPC